MSITLTAIAPLIMLAVLAEAVTEQIKDVLPTDLLGTPQAKRLVSLIVGLALAAMLRVSLFADATGSVQVVGILLAGLLCSRGANYVHDVFGMFAKVGDTIGQSVDDAA